MGQKGALKLSRTLPKALKTSHEKDNDKIEDSSYKMHSVSKQNKNAKKYLTASTNDYITLWKPSSLNFIAFKT